MSDIRPWVYVLTDRKGWTIVGVPQPKSYVDAMRRLSKDYLVLVSSEKLLVRQSPNGKSTQIFIHPDLLEKGGT